MTLIAEDYYRATHGKKENPSHRNRRRRRGHFWHASAHIASRCGQRLQMGKGKAGNPDKVQTDAKRGEKAGMRQSSPARA
ncbi:hypothetical protein NDO48_24935 [Aminobacter sp. MET-1]|nr:hypothetical protein [Aminobacter sp. MET-1]